ncbi:immunity protein YezG family protein [Endozoicomonas arenosclerae]|uniref:immunity protein YezG family protein n=1 Tax=Endozoicomonas arenosclerae TaxID=1633495 RepID=UPI0007829591|nr:immunity protein YezG family protein [Endozoicomonas arenosclerae]
MTIDEIYSNIATRIVDAISEDWAEAFIEFEYFGDSGEYKGRYITSSSEETKNFKVGYKTYKEFKKLHDITTEGESDRWNRAKFTLYPTGKFNIDFEWDQDLADEIAANS